MTRLNATVAAALVAASLLACLLVAAAEARAAGVRLTWQHEGSAEYDIYVSQAAEGGEHFFVEHVGMADAVADGALGCVVRGLDPLRTAFFFLVAVDALGRVSAPSRIIGVSAEDFCMAFDVDRDGEVTIADVMLVLRRVVDREGTDDVTVSDAQEMLVLATELACDDRLATIEARAASPSW